MEPDADQTHFSDWLRRYGVAWESRDSDGVAALFTEDAEYFWTPFDNPKRGRAQIATAWNEATLSQTDIKFRFEVLSATKAIGIAKWHTQLSRTATGAPTELDGILVAEFDDTGRCKTFREWWHANDVDRSVSRAG